MTERRLRGRCFEDFQVGDRFESSGRTIGEATIENFCGISGDWSDVHADEEAMRAGAFGGRIAHGILTFAVMQGLMCQTAYTLGTAVATLGWDALRFPLPVKIGDTVRARWTVTELRPSASRPRCGIVVEQCELVNQRGETVLTGRHALMVWRRPGPENTATGG